MLWIALAGWVLAAVVGGGGCVVLRRRIAAEHAARARAAHELRGPLCAVRLGLAACARGGAVAARLEALDAALDRAALALEDLEADGHPVSLRHADELVAVDELVAEVAAPLSRAGADSADGARVSVRPGPPAELEGDRRRLGQALANVVANAVEHGGGCVDIGWRRAGDRLWIEVSDDGPGLPAPVAKLAASARRRRSRHGHGLAIATAAVEAHGGRVSAAPSERGARVVIELPLPGRARRAGSAEGAGGAGGAGAAPDPPRP